MRNTEQTIELFSGTVEEKREEIKNYFLKTYELDEKLFELLKSKQSLYEQPNNLRHPLIFYYGHTATFFINKLNISKLSKKRINRYFESIFAIGVDEMSWDDLNSQNYQWPPYEEVKLYRQEVKQLVLEVIESLEFTIPINWDSPAWIILMGIEHENIHIETSSVLLRELNFDFLKTDELFLYCNEGGKAFPTNQLLEVKFGTVLLEKSFQNPLYYGWDNEFATHTATLQSFKASQYLVSNGEFLEFVENGGYKNFQYFSKEGQNWLEFTKATHPTFWIKKDDGYYLREINRIVPLPLNYPVDVNYYEAEAFCNYKSEQLGFEVRLPSEDEYYRLYDYVEASSKEANIGLRYFNQTPVDKFVFEKEEKKFYDVIGNVWQWSLTPIYPFEGFQTHPSYDDFTTPTFDDKHALIKGGSFISLGNEMLRSARYAFRKHFFQHAGFRYVQSKNPYRTKLNDKVYITDKQIALCCDFHYGEDPLCMENFFKNSIQLLKPYLKNIQTKKALDLGCGVGRSSFELAKIFDEVMGIDFSANYINVAIKLQTFEFLTYPSSIKENSFSLKDFDLEQVKDKVTFMQGDGCNLKEMYQGYDLIYCTNLLEKLYDPEKFLKDVAKRINPNGILVYIKDKKEIFSFETMKNILQYHFELVDSFETQYQHGISETSVWRKI